MRVVLRPDRPRLEVELLDGSTAVLSPLEHSDQEWLEQGFEELSVESRYSRFGVGTAALSDRELHYLAAVDQRSHVAWGASIDESGAGVGRYIADADDPCPEVAITVLDEFQGNGLGTMLLRALVATARADGVKCLRFEVALDNSQVRMMLLSFSSGVEIADDSTQGHIDLDRVSVASVEAAMVDVMNQVRV